jgi:glycosyltransferase involved in cell wall biosynthesis
MKILIVSSYLPYPLFSGGHIRLYNIIKRLSEHNHQITLICEKRPHQTDQDIAEITKICKKVVTVDRKKQWSFTTIFHAIFSSDSFLITGHTNLEMQKEIAKALQNDTFNLIHAETSYIMQNIPQTTTPIVLVEHNIEYLVYQRFVDSAFLLLRPFLAWDVRKLKKAEEAFWKKATYNVTVSEREKKIINLPNVGVVPNGVDTNIFQMKKELHIGNKPQADILFIGDFKWIQNRDSARWIIKEIYPKLENYFKHAKKTVLWIIGKHIPTNLKNSSLSDSIIFDENNQQPTEKIFSEADVLLSPIRIGGGTQYKILEAMASGTPVVTTQLGIEGIDARDEENVLVGETSHDLARLTARVLEDEDLYIKIAKNARSFIEKSYTWESIVRKLENVYKIVVPV